VLQVGAAVADGPPINSFWLPYAVVQQVLDSLRCAACRTTLACGLASVSAYPEFAA
jgi:hypothetical protein